MRSQLFPSKCVGSQKQNKCRMFLIASKEKQNSVFRCLFFIEVTVNYRVSGSLARNNKNKNFHYLLFLNGLSGLASLLKWDKSTAALPLEHSGVAGNC